MALGDDDVTSDVTGSPGATQDDHIIAIQTELGKDALLLTSLDGVEAMSRSFVYTVEVLTRLPDERVRTLLGKPVTLWLQNDDEARRRPLHGHARHLRRLELNSRGLRRWRMEVCPWLWFLTKSVDCRIYQHLSVPEILRSVFTDHALLHHQFRLLEQYPKLEFCVQYRESAFDFVSRLMEHVGIAYWFEHQEDRHVMVIADSNQMAPFTQPRQATQSMRADLGDIQEMAQDFAIRTGACALNDYDFEVPSKNLRTHEASILAAHPLSRFETYDYPGHFTGADEGKRLTRLRMEEEEARHVVVSGLASTAAFHPGRRFELMPDLAMGVEKPVLYLLTEIRHRARDSRYYADAGEPPSYSNRFVCIPAETPFRPERLTPKPTVQGSQTATVVGPAGENIHTDSYGRVRLLFHWDRRGERNERASCWVRVSQQSAGSQWGGLSIPHVGQEVIVEFLEGDPDRPLVTGHLHNGANMPPLNLPRDRNKTILRDHGDNKLIMQGQAGKQWMSMVSPRAINFIAMKAPAKPLSAEIASGVAPNFEDDLDSGSFAKLQQVYNELANPPPPSSQTITSTGVVTSGSPGSTITSTGTLLSTPDPNALSLADDPSKLASLGDFSASGPGVDINTLSEGNISSVSLGNTNAWIGGELNQEVIGRTHTISRSKVQNTFLAQVTDDFDLFHEENSVAHNEFTGVHSEVVGAHGEVTLAHVEATGVHVEDTILHMEMHTGIHWTWDKGFTSHLNTAVEYDEKGVKIVDTKLEVSTFETTIKQINSKLENCVTKTELTQELHSITSLGVLSLSAVKAISIKGGQLLAMSADGILTVTSSSISLA